jgi:hypothetical protein
MTWIDIDKELEWVTAWDRQDRHVGVISKHECVVDVEWVEELLMEVKRLRDLHILACDYLQSISDGTLPDGEWPHIHAMIRGEEE